MALRDMCNRLQPAHVKPFSAAYADAALALNGLPVSKL